MSGSPGREEHLFVVRLWREPSRVSAPTWRGFVEHALSSRRFYFTSFADLNDFIRLWLDAPAEWGRAPGPDGSQAGQAALSAERARPQSDVLGGKETDDGRA